MKIADMNTRQKKAFINIKYAANYLIGGLENTMLDNPEGSEDYEQAKATLANHAGLVAEIYNMATTQLCQDGCVLFGQSAEAYIKDIRFCGKVWLMERVEARVRKLDY